MKALTFLLRLKSPLLAAQTQSGEPNSASTSLFIPGSMIRGAVIAQLPQSVKDNLAADTGLRRIYLEGGARFLNAYPAHPTTGARLLPKPLSWRVPKSEGSSRTAQIHDFAVKPVQLDKPKSPGAGEFAWLEGGTATLYSPRLHITVHNASDDRNRKQADTSQVYRYEALADGEVFAGVVIGDDDALNQIEPLLTGDVLLGGSRTGGYGLAEIVDVCWVDDWKEYPAPEAAPSDQIIVTLLSDVIVRGADGNFSPSLDAALGAASRPPSFTEMRVVGGFNRKWGLPLTQDWAVAAGSVFEYPASAIDPAKRAQALAEGIGERRAEGFGRLAFNWHTRETWTQADPGSRPATLTPEPLTVESRALAQRMAERQLRALLDERLIAAVAGASKKITRAASPSQMSRVRLAARQALFKRDLQPVLDHLESLYDEKGKEKVGARQLRELRVDNTPLLVWLREQAGKPDLRAEFGIEDADLPQVAGYSAVIDKALQAEYMARLMDGVLKSAIKHVKANNVPGKSGGKGGAK